MARTHHENAEHIAEHPVLVRELDDKEISLVGPVVAGEPLTDVLAAHINRMVANGFSAIINKEVTERGKSFSEDELLARYDEYRTAWLSRMPGERGEGASTRELAAERFVRETLTRMGKSWPTMPKITKKMSDADRATAEAKQAEVEAARQSYIDKALASTKPETVARIDELVAEIRAERKREKPSAVVAVSADELSI